MRFSSSAAGFFVYLSVTTVPRLIPWCCIKFLDGLAFQDAHVAIGGNHVR